MNTTIVWSGQWTRRHRGLYSVEWSVYPTLGIGTTMETDRGPSGSQAGADTVLPLPMVQQQTLGTTSGQVSVSVGYPGCQHSAPVLSITLRQLSTYTHLVNRGGSEKC